MALRGPRRMRRAQLRADDPLAMQKCQTHQMTRSDRVGISNLLAMASILMGEPSAPGPRALILLTF